VEGMTHTEKDSPTNENGLKWIDNFNPF